MHSQGPNWAKENFKFVLKCNCGPSLFAWNMAFSNCVVTFSLLLPCQAMCTITQISMYLQCSAHYLKISVNQYIALHVANSLLNWTELNWMEPNWIPFCWHKYWLMMQNVKLLRWPSVVFHKVHTSNHQKSALNQRLICRISLSCIKFADQTRSSHQHLF